MTFLRIFVTSPPQYAPCTLGSRLEIGVRILGFGENDSPFVWFNLRVFVLHHLRLPDPGTSCVFPECHRHPEPEPESEGWNLTLGLFAVFCIICGSQTWEELNEFNVLCTMYMGFHFVTAPERMSCPSGEYYSPQLSIKDTNVAHLFPRRGPVTLWREHHQVKRRKMSKCVDRWKAFQSPQTQIRYC